MGAGAKSTTPSSGCPNKIVYYETDFDPERDQEQFVVTFGKFNKVQTGSRMAQPVELYYALPSPPCRSVMMVAKAIGLNLTLKPIDMMMGDHLTPEFIKINPHHTLPTINDNGLILWESRAILCYLMNQYAVDDALYPKDPKKRALVDMKLYFDALVLNSKFVAYFAPVLRGKESPNPEKRKQFESTLDDLNKQLENSEWIAGDSMTVADISIVSTVSTADAAGIDVHKHSNISKWYKKCKADIIDYEETNESGANMFGQFFLSKANN